MGGTPMSAPRWNRRNSSACAATLASAGRLAARRRQFRGTDRSARRQPQSVAVDAGAAVGLRRLGGVGVIVVELPHIGFQFTANQLFWLAALWTIRGLIPPAVSPSWYRFSAGATGPVFSTALLLLPTLWIGVAVQDPNTRYPVFVAIALLLRTGWQLLLQHGQYQLLLSRRLQGTALGLNAGIGNLGVGLAQLITPIAVYGGALVLGGSPQTMRMGRDDSNLGAKRRIHLGSVHCRRRRRRLLGHGQHCQRQGGFRRTGRDLQAQTSMADELALHRHFRFFHRLGGWIPDAGQHHFPWVDAFQFAFVGPLLAAFVRPIGGWLADRVGGQLSPSESS